MSHVAPSLLQSPLDRATDLESFAFFKSFWAENIRTCGARLFLFFLDGSTAGERETNMCF